MSERRIERRMAVVREEWKVDGRTNHSLMLSPQVCSVNGAQRWQLPNA